MKAFLSETIGLIINFDCISTFVPSPIFPAVSILNLELSPPVLTSKFAPANTDQSLIDYLDFPQLLEEWAKQVLDGNEQSTWQNRLIERAIRGVDYDKVGDGKAQTLIRLQPRWAPQNSNFRSWRVE